MRRVLALVPLIFVSPILAADNDDVRKDLKALEGKWKAVAVEFAGNPLPKENIPDFSFVVAAGGKATGRTDQGEFQFTMTIDPKKAPKTIENSHESGPQKGKKQYGIYKLEGDKFTVCMSPPGAAESDRPKEFSSKDSTGVLFVFERVKEEK
jgi:uncharacterized protein (TIGR03067 family)